MTKTSATSPESDASHRSNPRNENAKRTEWNDRTSSFISPKAALDDVVSSLQIMMAESSASVYPSNSEVELHGALLLFELGGRAENIPSISLGVSARRSIERRVASSARHLAGREIGDEAAFTAWKRAAHRIEELLDLIDPGLRAFVAS
jgi:hypothetical protein